jgi:hypothetical protein
MSGKKERFEVGLGGGWAGAEVCLLSEDGMDKAIKG